MSALQKTNILGEVATLDSLNYDFFALAGR
jgi:hypothetical protein